MKRPDHGMVGTGTYRSWASMVTRCTNQNYREFHLYGGRGISISPLLRKFEDFLAVLGPRPEGLSLDRIDNSKNYEPGNVRWTDRKTQNRNRRSNRPLTFCGKTMVIADWSAETGIKRATIAHRLDKSGWTVADALTVPVIAPKYRSQSNLGQKI